MNHVVNAVILIFNVDMSLFGKLRMCEGRCTTCNESCNLHLKHASDCYCESVDCALERMTMKKCYKSCVCESTCNKDRNHEDECFCGHENHLWRGSDFLVDPMHEVDRNEKCCEETPEGPCQDFKGHQFAEGRPNWHNTWMEIARAVGKRSYDTRLKVGAIIVSEDNTSMLSLGYNGNGAGLPNVPDSAEPGQSGFIHAEINAIIKCSYHYPTAKVMYVTDSPCRQCAKCILNAKIKTVIYDREYRDTSGLELLKQGRVVVHKLSDLLQQK